MRQYTSVLKHWFLRDTLDQGLIELLFVVLLDDHHINLVL